MLLDGANALPHRPPPLGPGSLVLVVGPSGAGKDTLIAYARQRLAGETRIVFPRRLITRDPDPALEDHATVSAEDFARKVEGGRFALHWNAHDLSYGVPAEIDESVAAGAVVVVNVSRGVISAARNRYADVLPLRVAAPAAMLAERLRTRGRENPAEIERRLSRYGAADDLGGVVEIVNDGPIERAGEALVAVLVDRLRLCAMRHSSPTNTPGVS